MLPSPRSRGSLSKIEKLKVSVKKRSKHQSIKNVTCEKKVNRNTSKLLTKCSYFLYDSESGLYFEVTCQGNPQNIKNVTH